MTRLNSRPTRTPWRQTVDGRQISHIHPEGGSPRETLPSRLYECCICKLTYEIDDARMLTLTSYHFCPSCYKEVLAREEKRYDAIKGGASGATSMVVDKSAEFCEYCGKPMEEKKKREFKLPRPDFGKVARRSVALLINLFFVWPVMTILYMVYLLLSAPSIWGTIFIYIYKWAIEAKNAPEWKEKVLLLLNPLMTKSEFDHGEYRDTGVVAGAVVTIVGWLIFLDSLFNFMN